MSVIVYIFRTSNYELPATLTKLYELYIHSAKVHYLQSECNDPELPLTFDEKSTFPQGTQEVYSSLCTLALWGLDQERPRMVFKDRELENLNLSPLLVKEAKTVGLMTAYKSFTVYGVQRSFQFIHATIQEYLAADAISRQPPHQQLEFIQRHFTNPRFRMILSFLAGRTGLKFVEGMFHIPLSFEGHPNVSLVQMLYEAQNSQLCHILAQNVPENSLQLSKLVSIAMLKISELDLICCVTS